LFDQAQQQWQEKFTGIKQMKGKENPYKLHAELSETMMSNVLIVRDNARLAATVEKIEEYDERWKDVECVDTSDWTNPVPSFVNQLYNMIQLSKVIAKGALLRDEFRGAHYKPEFEIKQPSDFKPESFLEYTKLKAEGGLKQDSFKPDHLEYMRLYGESNEKWLKSSIATFNGKGPDISYEPVDTSLIQPRPRKYD